MAAGTPSTPPITPGLSGLLGTVGTPLTTLIPGEVGSSVSTLFGPATGSMDDWIEMLRQSAAQQAGVPAPPAQASATTSLIPPAVPTPGNEYTGIEPPQSIIQTDYRGQVIPPDPSQTPPAAPSVPTFTPPPAAPVFENPLMPPTRDRGAEQQDAINAAHLALIPQALLTLFGSHADANLYGRATPGLIADAAGAAHKYDDSLYGDALQQWQMGQDNVNTANRNAQTLFGDTSANVAGTNENAQRSFADQSALYQADQNRQMTQQRIDAQRTQALQKAKAGLLKFVASLDPSAQEAYLANSQDAQALGITPQYDSQGNYIPLQTQRDVNGATTAGAAAARAKSYATYVAEVAKQRGVSLDIAQKRLTEYARHNGVTEAQAAQNFAVNQQRANAYVDHIHDLATRMQATAFGSRDPAKMLSQLDNQIAEAQSRRAAASREINKPFPPMDDQTKMQYGAAIDSYTRMIQDTRAYRDAVAASLHPQGSGGAAPVHALPASPGASHATIVGTNPAAGQGGGTLAPAPVATTPGAVGGGVPDYTGLSIDQLRKLPSDQQRLAKQQLLRRATGGG